MAAAGAAGIVLLIAAGIALGTVFASPGGSQDSEHRLQRIELASAEQRQLLDRTTAELRSAHAELEEARARSTALARDNARLRTELRRAKRALRSTRRTRRAR